MNWARLNLTILLLLASPPILIGAQDRGMAKKNPIAYFSPDLKRVERKSRSLGALCLKLPSRKTSWNNPFLSSSQRKFAGFEIDRSCSLEIEGEEYSVIPSGWIRLRGESIQKSLARLNSQLGSHFLQINPVNDEQLVVIQFPYQLHGSNRSIPVLIQGADKGTDLQLFRELLKKSRSLLTELNLLLNLRLKNTEFQQMLEDLVTEHYRDDFGQRNDFLEYLLIKREKIQNIQPYHARLDWQGNKLKLTLSFEREQNFLFLRLQFNEKGKVNSYSIEES